MSSIRQQQDQHGFKAPLYSKRRGKTPKCFTGGPEPQRSHHGVRLHHLLRTGGSPTRTNPPPHRCHSNTVLTASAVFGNLSLTTFQMCWTLPACCRIEPHVAAKAPELWV